MTFGFALIIIFLALAALFESFRDPRHHPGVGANVDRRRVDLRQRRRRGRPLNIYTEVGWSL